MPSFSLQSLASVVGGTVVGDSNVQINNALPQRDAVAGCVTLADSSQQAVKAQHTPAAAVVVAEACSDCSLPQLVVSDIHAAFIKLVLVFRPHAVIDRSNDPTRISDTAVIDPSTHIGRGVQVGARVMIGANCTIGERTVLHPGVTIMDHCQIGEDCEIYPGCVLYPDTKVGNRVLIHANAVLGAFGFGYRPQNGKHVRTAQLGWVELHDDVEIGAATTIDRGTYGATRIGQGTKIDNHVQIGHNCHIGAHNLICALVGIAGSCTTGDYVVMAGQVGLADHLHVADRAMIGAQSGLMSNVGVGEVMLGSPAMPRKQKFVELATVSKLPEMRKDLIGLIKRVEQLESQSDRSIIQDREAA